MRPERIGFIRGGDVVTSLNQIRVGARARVRGRVRVRAMGVRVRVRFRIRVRVRNYFARYKQ